MIDDFFEELAASGWLVNNLYQYDNGTWRVNLRRPDGTGDWFTDWATGPTLALALDSAITKLAQAEYTSAEAQTYSLDTTTAMESLALRLGLKPKPVVRRRI